MRLLLAWPKRVIRWALQRLGYDIVDRITRDDPPERHHIGLDPFLDMGRFVPRDDAVIFDVGANTGDSVVRFREWFPKSEVHSFEPGPPVFATLQDNVGALDGVILTHCAIGSSDGEMTFYENSRPVYSSFLPLGETGVGEIVRETPVAVRTIDSVVKERGIERIRVLKIDTQGFELEVLRGAERSMRDGKIDLVYLEIIVGDLYKNLPGLEQIVGLLSACDFRLVSFYNERYDAQLQVQSDGLFIHRRRLDELNHARSPGGEVPADPSSPRHDPATS